MMNGIGFSPRAQRLIAALAQDEGRKSGADQLLPEHVLLALLKSAEGLGYTLLRFASIRFRFSALSNSNSNRILHPPPSRICLRAAD